MPKCKSRRKLKPQRNVILNLKKRVLLNLWGHIEMSIEDSYENIWDAIADTAGESANMQAKAELMRQLVVIIKKNDCRTSN